MNLIASKNIIQTPRWSTNFIFISNILLIGAVERGKTM